MAVRRRPRSRLNTAASWSSGTALARRGKKVAAKKKRAAAGGTTRAVIKKKGVKKTASTKATKKKAQRATTATAAKRKQSKPAKANKPARRATRAAAKPVNGTLRRQAARVVKHLKADYPDAECALRHKNAFELLIATILSAQCTDERVNIVTKGLFARYPTPADLARLPLPKLEKEIQSTGFFRNKAKSIQGCCRKLVEEYDGRVPRELDQLVALPGIGRKTANVVLGTAFGLATGVVVDTHVGRISRRLGLTQHTDAVKVEQDLIQLLPQEEWINYSHRMIHHGRRICNARKPKCGECSMESFCPKVAVSN